MYSGEQYNWNTNLSKIESFIHENGIGVSSLFFRIRRNMLVNKLHIKSVLQNELKVEMSFENRTELLEVPKLKTLKELTEHHFPLI